MKFDLEQDCPEHQEKPPASLLKTEELNDAPEKHNPDNHTVIVKEESENHKWSTCLSYLASCCGFCREWGRITSFNCCCGLLNGDACRSGGCCGRKNHSEQLAR